MTYQSLPDALEREGVEAEVIIAVELRGGERMEGAEMVYWKHPDEVLSLEPTILDLPDLHYALTRYCASRAEPGTRLVCSCFDNLPGKNRQTGGLAWQGAFDLYIARSSMAANVLLLEGVPKDKIRVISPGVDTDMFAPLPFVPDTRVVLTVARVTLEKGIQDLIWAMAGLDAELWVVGDGRIDVFAQMAEEYEVSARFLGAVPHEDLPGIYQEATVFVLVSLPLLSHDPLRAWVEQWGVAVTEAMASGLPVITTGVGAFHEIVRPEGGFIIPCRRWDILHERLQLILSDPVLQQRMGVFNRHRAVNLLSSEMAGRRLASQYLALLEEK
jgi:glycosyltransferase involved in cell wall biosynthesis